MDERTIKLAELFPCFLDSEGTQQCCYIGETEKEQTPFKPEHVTEYRGLSGGHPHHDMGQATAQDW